MLKKYAQNRWGLATRERHFIEPVTGGYVVRSCAYFYFYANYIIRPRYDADKPKGRNPQAVHAELQSDLFPFTPARLANDC